MVLLLLAGVTGAFLTGDLFNLYVWFEVMLIASFGLMVLGGRPIQLDGAVKYGFLNFLATTFSCWHLAWSMACLAPSTWPTSCASRRQQTRQQWPVLLRSCCWLSA